MYIRSQDDNMLIPVDGMVVSISYDGDNEIILSSPHDGNSEGYFIVGRYESKERCFDILNDIQHTLQQCFAYKIYESCELPSYKSGVYTMPSE